MKAMSGSQPIHLNPLQQWRYYSTPLSMVGWIREKYGDLVPISFGGHEYIGITSAEVARQVFSADPNGYDVSWKESFIGLLGEESVFVLIGEKHRKERLLFSPAVHANHFRAYGNIVRDIARRHFDSWQAGQTVRALDTTLSIALDVIMRLVFGVADRDLIDEGRVVTSELTRAAHPLIVFYPQLQRSWFPFWQRYSRAQKNLYAWLDRVIALRRAEENAGEDVLSVLMNARDEDGTLFSDEHIKNELLSILSAGHVNTSVALAWSFYELGKSPAILQKLRLELSGLDETSDPSALALPYLDAVCKETLRLHPVVAECARVPMQPMEIAGYHIPAGRTLSISIVGIHQDPTLYPEPTVFRPERFLDRKYSVYEFLPFGGGHRRCMGAGLAEFTMRIALAQMVTSWDFETVKPDHDIRRNIAMGPKYGIRLKVKSRRASSVEGTQRVK